MRRKLQSVVSVFVLMLLFATGRPAVAIAQPRGHGGSLGVVVQPSYFHGPASDPGLAAGYQWGYPYGYPVTADASVRLDVKPRDAFVYVDGYYAGVVEQFNGTFQRLHVLPGRHEIVVYKEGYRSVKERLYLSPNSSRKLTHEMEKLPAGEPNEPIPTPSEDPQAPPQPPDPGAPAQSGRSGPPQGPSPQSRQGVTGSVAIRVQPGDAEIFIDGERWAGADDESLVVELPEGRHQIEVRKTGYRPVTREVEVHRGQTAPVSIGLSPQ